MAKNNYLCDRCKTPTYIRPSLLKKQEKSFCGIECYSAYRIETSKNNHTCPNCKNVFYSRYYNAKFCSRRCSNESRKGMFYDGLKTGCKIASQAIQREYLAEKNGNKCSICNIPPVWNDKFLVLQIDHIDGDRKNNTYDNLRLLCPNCHTQTETWGRRKGQA